MLRCWFGHHWEEKTIVRRESVRYLRRCRRCGETTISRVPPSPARGHPKRKHERT